MAAAVLVLTSVFYLYSCKKENPVVHQQAPVENKEIVVNKTSAKANCGKPICFSDVICSGSICVSVGRVCVDLIPCIDFKLPDCQLVDCGNPWNYKDPFINPIPRFFDYYKGNPEPQPNFGFFTYGVTEKIAWLQFYAPVKNVLDQQVLNLDKAIQLDKQIALQQDLKGNIIPAGSYPVVFDIKTKTYNAIVKVQ